MRRPLTAEETREVLDALKDAIDKMEPYYAQCGAYETLSDLHERFDNLRPLTQDEIVAQRERERKAQKDEADRIRREARLAVVREAQAKLAQPTTCPHCGKTYTIGGLNDHIRMKHGGGRTVTTFVGGRKVAVSHGDGRTVAIRGNASTSRQTLEERDCDEDGDPFASRI